VFLQLFVRAYEKQLGLLRDQAVAIRGRLKQNQVKKGPAACTIRLLLPAPKKKESRLKKNYARLALAARCRGKRKADWKFKKKITCM
jgi:hypothetical protein